MAGHDINYIAIGGFPWTIGRPGQPPSIPGNIFADYAAGGMMAAFAISSALYARDRIGRGQYVDVAMSDGVLYLLAQYANVLQGQDPPQPGAAATSGLLPHYEVYECADGEWLSIGALEPQFWANLCEVVGREDFKARWADVVADPPGNPDVREHLAATFKQKPRDQWFAEMRSIDVCAGPVYSLDEAFADPHNRERMVVEVEDEEVGTVPVLGIGPKLSETPGSIRRITPEFGEHTEVLASLGYDEGSIAELRAQGVVT